MASSVHTELMNESFCWSANTGVSMYRSPWENTYEFVLTSSTCFACCFWMVCKIGEKWQYNCFFTGCRFQDQFKKYAPFFSSSHLAFSLRVQVVHANSSTNTAIAWKNSPFILLEIRFPYSRSPVYRNPGLRLEFWELPSVNITCYHSASIFNRIKSEDRAKHFIIDEKQILRYKIVDISHCLAEN